MARTARKQARKTPKRKAAKAAKRPAKRTPPKTANAGMTAYLAIRGAADALAFYRKAFGAVEKFRLVAPDGRIGHAEFEVAGSLVMISDEHPEYGAVAPPTLGGTPVRFHLKVDNADKWVKRAVKAGARLDRPVQNQFYGERSGMVTDPFGYSWFIGHDVEKVSPKEMRKRFAAMMKG